MLRDILRLGVECKDIERMEQTMHLKDYIKLYKYMVKNNIMAQMEYKANFISSIVTEIAFLMSKALYIIVIYSVGLSIHGVTPHQMLMFIGSYTVITGIMDSVYYPNIASIPEYIRSGELDIYLTKPISTQFLASFRKFNLGLGIPNVLAGVIMIVVSWNLSNVPVTLTNIIGYIIFTIIGSIITYPLLFFPTIFAFWFVKTDALYDFTFSSWDFNNMPMTIYNKVLQRIGIFLIPIFILTNFAPMFVFGMLPFLYQVYAFLAVPIFVGLVILFWNKAIKSYTSASS